MQIIAAAGLLALGIMASQSARADTSGAALQGQRHRRHHRLFDGDPDRCAPGRGRSLRALRQGGEIPRGAGL